MKKLFFLGASIAALIFSSCNNEPEVPLVVPSKATVRFSALWEGEPFVMQQVYTDTFGNRLRADAFMNYISLITLVKDDGTEVLIKDYSLINFYSNNEVTAEVPAGKYTTLKFGIGVPRGRNKDQDPAQYPSSSALSVAGSQGMFWVWNTGYIFAKFEGKCDTTGTAGTELLTPIAIHAGDDASYREFFSQPFNQDITGISKTFEVQLSVDRIFAPANGNDVNIALQAITHTSTNPDLAANYMDNFLAALALVP